MHTAVREFIKSVKKEFGYKFRLRTVLEVGSHNINGSPRDFFWLNKKYVGVDISTGKGVNIVGRLSQIVFEEQFGVVVSTEMLEHDNEYRQSLRKMYDLLLPGGLMLITCAGPDRLEHGTKRTSPECSPDTTDYYHNISTDEFRKILPECLFESYILMYARGKNDLQFYGIKHREGKIPRGVTGKEIYAALLDLERERLNQLKQSNTMKTFIALANFVTPAPNSKLVEIKAMDEFFKTDDGVYYRNEDGIFIMSKVIEENPEYFAEKGSTVSILNIGTPEQGYGVTPPAERA